MKFQFDPTKDEANIAKHGVSLARSGDMEILAVLEDDRRDYGETRYRAWGLIDGTAHCLAFVVRNDAIRPISLRRAHKKEMDQYGPRSKI